MGPRSSRSITVPTISKASFSAQLSERPVIKIRIFGRSEMPKCECRTAVFATGNDVAFKRVTWSDVVSFVILRR